MQIVQIRHGYESSKNSKRLESIVELVTDPERQKLIANGLAQRAAKDCGDSPLDFEPVCKLTIAGANIVFLLTEIIPDTELAFGLCDFGVGTPHMGQVSLRWLQSVVGPLNRPAQRDARFVPTGPVSAYARIGTLHGRIVT